MLHNTRHTHAPILFPTDDAQAACETRAYLTLILADGQALARLLALPVMRVLRARLDELTAEPEASDDANVLAKGVACMDRSVHNMSEQFDCRWQSDGLRARRVQRGGVPAWLWLL